MRSGAMTLLRGALSCCLLALALGGCGATNLVKHTTYGRAAATATATPAPTLSWRKISLPAGTSTAVGGIEINGPTVSPVDGRHAWLCAPGSGGSVQIWFTQDAGATWRQISALTPLAPSPITSCELSPNQDDANAIAVNLSWGDVNGPATGQRGSRSYYFFDGGVAWTTLPQDLWISQVGAAGGVTYANLLNTAAQTSTLVTSADHLTTWRAITPTDSASTPNTQLWTASAPNELLWAAMNTKALYHSTDGGATWTLLPAPSGKSVQVTMAAWQASASGWLICGYLPTAKAQDPTENLCTADLGATWLAHPALRDTWECGHCTQSGGSSTGVNPCLASAISTSGAIYSICGNDTQDSGAPPTPWTISRLSPGASTWSTIGQTPCQDFTITQTGQAWCFDVYGKATYVLDQLP